MVSLSVLILHSYGPFPYFLWIDGIFRIGKILGGVRISKFWGEKRPRGGIEISGGSSNLGANSCPYTPVDTIPRNLRRSLLGSRRWGRLLWWGWGRELWGSRRCDGIVRSCTRVACRWGRRSKPIGPGCGGTNTHAVETKHTDHKHKTSYDCSIWR